MISRDLDRWLAKEILIHERSLRAYIARFFSEPSDVEDIVQETYARVISLSDTARAAVRQWQAFLFTTARNVALDRLRKARVVSLDAVAEIGALELADEQLSAYEELSARQELAMLAGAIAALPERCRQVLTLRKLDGLSQKEIARRLEISESTVEKHVANGVRLCAAWMLVLQEGGERNSGTAVRGNRKSGFDVQ